MTKVMDLEDEIWKDIPNYEGLYQASSLGRIRTFDKHLKGRGETLRVAKGKILKHWIARVGYPQIELTKEGIDKKFSVHYLVLKTFRGERPRDFVCMHLNDIKTDNRLVNLKWGTQSENILDSHQKGIAGAAIKKPVEALCLNTGQKLFFESRAEAKRKLGAKNIDKVLTGERPHCKNYHFKYI